MIILAIDPGVQLCACATLYDAGLARIFYKAPAESLDGRTPDLVVVERPEYQGARSDAARTQDLIALAWQGARAAYSVGVEVREVTPREWKGSEAKPPQHLRLWEDCLTDDEKKLFPADTGKRIMKAAERYALNPGKYPGASAYGRGKGSEVHNLLDAAALGCAFVGRFR